MHLLQYYLLFAVVSNLLYFATTWKLFQKAGKKAWQSLIPFYNIVITLQIIHRPWWWIFIVFIPIVGPIMCAVILVDFIRHFNRRTNTDALLVLLLSVIFLGYINYSPQTKYTGKEERKETFISAVLFAVVFATIIHAFIIQPFTIPTASMERTLLVGDFLFVSKMNYGIRIPMTPVALPFLQNKIPIGDSQQPQKQTNSYVDQIRLPYMRLPGWTHVKRGDIVVFNYPTDSLHTAIDRKDPYVKRCVGLPGDIIKLEDGNLFVNGKPEVIKKDEEQQRNYFVYTTEAGISSKKIEEMFGYATYQEGQDEFGKRIYFFRGLTKENAAKLKELNTVDSLVLAFQKKGEPGLVYKDAAKTKIDTTNSVFPLNSGWNGSQYGPLAIPSKGETITLTKENIDQYRRIIKNYEHNELKEEGGKFYINGKETNQYTFLQNYYWMMGDNRDNSLDSRYFGYVPEDHIIGTPIFTWLSVQGLFENDPFGHPAKKKIRWDRMFKIPNTDTPLNEKTNYLPYFLILLGIYFTYDYYKGKKKKKDQKKKN
ncbi:signal peptidase I [Apibacter raozihei]|uniref:signal peptidase I n=1 Tax=Apibacter raozihei TaxID=2500547 RepID=UPI000FE3069C|nr:signal peptidase I [Apibacter raozihei]